MSLNAHQIVFSHTPTLLINRVGISRAERSSKCRSIRNLIIRDVQNVSDFLVLGPKQQFGEQRSEPARYIPIVVDEDLVEHRIVSLRPNRDGNLDPALLAIARLPGSVQTRCFRDSKSARATGECHAPRREPFVAHWPDRPDTRCEIAGRP